MQHHAADQLHIRVTYHQNPFAGSIAEPLQDRPLAQRLGEAARNTILQRFQLESCLKRQLGLMSLVASGSLGG